MESWTPLDAILAPTLALALALALVPPSARG